MNNRPDFTADPREANLYWSITPRGKTIAYFRRTLDGRTKWQSLGEVDRETAVEVVRKLRKESDTERLLTKLQMITKRPDVATLGEVLEAHKQYVAGADIGEQTARGYRNCLRRLVAVARGLEGDAAIDAQRVSILTPDLLRDYSAAVVAATKADSLKGKHDAEAAADALATAQRTIRSTAQQARAIFAREARASASFRELALPDLSAFLAHKVGESTIVRYRAIPPAVLARIVADAPALRQADSAAWAALVLIGATGMRRGSAADAKWDWFTVHPGSPAIAATGNSPAVEAVPARVEIEIRRAKGNPSTLAFPADLHAQLLELQTSPTYVLAGADREARDEVCGRVVAWLRARGLQELHKPLHAVRGEFINQMRQAHGISQAQAAAGHSSPALTSKVYSAGRTTDTVRVV